MPRIASDGGNRTGLSRKKIRVSVPKKEPAKKLDAIADNASAELLKTIFGLKSIRGTGQEMGDEADGPEVNHRRTALSVLMSRYSDAELEKRLPKSRGKVVRNIREDLKWLRRAERQSLAKNKDFDFSWSLNPMSTPEVLKELSQRRADAARSAAEAIKEDPSRTYDASNDCVLCHLSLEQPKLRSQVLADTLIQFRSARRSEALMDAHLGEGEEDEYFGRAEGRIGSSGAVSAFEQRLACTMLGKRSAQRAKRAKKEGSAGTLAFDAEREYALTRMVVGNHTSGSINGIYASRNTIGILPDFLDMDVMADPISGEHDASFYDAIHKNYSANTPKAVDFYLRERAFSDGPKADRIEILRTLVRAGRSEDLQEAKALLKDLQEERGYTVPKTETARTASSLKNAIVRHLRKHCNIPTLKRGLDADDTLHTYDLLLAVHKSVCLDRPTADTLQKSLFYAGSAWQEVANLISALRVDDHEAQVEAVGAARKALHKAFFSTKSGFDRQMLWRLDRQVELMSAEILGTAVERAEASDEPQQLGACLVAVRSALRSAIASGLHAVRGRQKTAEIPDLKTLLKEVDAVLAKKTTNVEDVRSLMTKIFRSANEVSDTMRGFFHQREGAIRFSKIDVDLDPGFSDNLIKETSLHYLLSLSQRGMNWGIKTEISANEIRFVSGMRTINSVGPRVYKRILQGDNPQELRQYKPGSDDLCILSNAGEKNLIYGGGLILDTKDAGPGYSHASVFAKGHAISAIALPNLAGPVTEFFNKERARPGFYVDDRSGSFVIKPLQAAIDEGLVSEGDVEKLRPGFNTETSYFDVNDDGEKVLQELSKQRISEHHEERAIELFVPDLSNRRHLKNTPTFEDLQGKPLNVIRQYAGEKGAVLVHLSKCEALKELGVKVPGGAIVPPFQIAEMMKKARVGGQSLYDRYLSVWQNDPKVGEVTNENFAKSAFYTDDAYRLGKKGVVPEMKKAVTKGLKNLLVKNGKPTASGKKLLKELARAEDLQGRTPWIDRSSFTGEDRPGKSGAGQYSSFPNLKTGAARLEGIIGVIASAWNESPIEANVHGRTNLQHIWPSVVVQKCMNPTVSGVAVSRGRQGGYGEVSYQAVEAFGGGVDGGEAEEGVIGRERTSVARCFQDEKASLLNEAQQKKLREAILAIETEFNENVEPGKHHAVDVEWAFEGDQLYILQARVITGV